MTDTSSRSRQAAGQRTGGQFKAEQHTEGGIELGASGTQADSPELAAERTEQFLTEALQGYEGALFRMEGDPDYDEENTPGSVASEALYALGLQRVEDPHNASLFTNMADALNGFEDQEDPISKEDVEGMAHDIAAALHLGRGWHQPNDKLEHNGEARAQELFLDEVGMSQEDNFFQGRTHYLDANWKFDEKTGVATTDAEVHLDESSALIEGIEGFVPERDGEALSRFMQQEYSLHDMEQIEAGPDGSLIYAFSAREPMASPTASDLENALQLNLYRLQRDLDDESFGKKAGRYIKDEATRDNGEWNVRDRFDDLDHAWDDESAYKHAVESAYPERGDFDAVACYATANYSATPGGFRAGAAHALRAGADAGSPATRAVLQGALAQMGQTPVEGDLDDAALDIRNLGEKVREVRKMANEGDVPPSDAAVAISALEAARGHLGKIVPPYHELGF